MTARKHASYRLQTRIRPATDHKRLCHLDPEGVSRLSVRRAISSGLGNVARVPSTCIMAALFGFLWLSAAANAEEAPVTIKGGFLLDDGAYHWVVTNHSPVPIVVVEFPHYQARLFIPPPGWKSKSTNLVNVGVPKIWGTCRAWVDSRSQGIPPGGTAPFGISVTQLESRPGLGVVTVELADGTKWKIENVEIPSPPTFIDRWGLLVCMAVFLGILALLAIRRRRREQRALQVAAHECSVT